MMPDTIVYADKADADPPPPPPGPGTLITNTGARLVSILYVIGESVQSISCPE
jgi:hypothetical protein